MYGLLAAIAFLTRLPAGKLWQFDADDVARACGWFPFVGAVLGGLYLVALWALSQIFPALVTAVLLVSLDALATGALHFDGLADTADGFGGGRSREDVLRIMRDHAIGSYGAVALLACVLMKVACIAALVEAHRAGMSVFLAPVVGRWAAVLLGATQPYARSDDLKPRYGHVELWIATVTALVFAAALDLRRGLLSCALIAAGSWWWSWRCRRRIGGVTGDTLGAAVEGAECVALLVFTGWR